MQTLVMNSELRATLHSDVISEAPAEAGGACA